MKSAVAVPVGAPAVGRRVSRSGKSAGVASGRKPAVARNSLPPCDSPADIPKLLRAMGRMGFMRRGRPEDYDELRKPE